MVTHVLRIMLTWFLEHAPLSPCPGLEKQKRRVVFIFPRLTLYCNHGTLFLCKNGKSVSWLRPISVGNYI